MSDPVTASSGSSSPSSASSPAPSSSSPSPSSPSFAGSIRWLAPGGLAAGCVCAAARRLGDFDLPWHLATGRQLVAARAAPSVDELSYPLRGAPIQGEYLSDLLLYLTVRVGGPLGLQLLALGAIAALAGLLVLRAGPGRRLAGIALAALALMVAGPWLVLRPALLSMAMLAAVLLVVERHRFGEGSANVTGTLTGTGTCRGTGRVSSLAWLIPLQLVWANLHGLAALGAVIALGYGLYRLACRIARGRLGGLLPVEDGGEATAALLIGLGAAGATCASSYGWRIFLNPLLLRGYAHSITEWQPTTLEFVLARDPLFALLALAALGAALLPVGRRLPSLFDVVLVLGALQLAWSAVRLIAIFAVITAPLVARRLAPLLDDARVRLGRPLALVCALVVAPALLLGPGPRAGLGWDAANLPLGAVEFAVEHRLAGPVWNFLPFGGWLAWRAHPSIRVFIDGRTGWLYPPEFVERYFHAQRDPAAFAALQQRWGFTWALVRARAGEHFDGPIARDHAWRMVYLDDSAALYVRDGSDDATRAGAGYRVLRHDEDIAWLLYGLDELKRRVGDLADYDHDTRLALEQAPDSLRARTMAAQAAAARGRCDEARAGHRWLLGAKADYAGTRLLGGWLDDFCPDPGRTTSTHP